MLMARSLIGLSCAAVHFMPESVDNVGQNICTATTLGITHLGRQHIAFKYSQGVPSGGGLLEW